MPRTRAAGPRVFSATPTPGRPWSGSAPGGFVDVVRKHNPQGGLYSWWDYRRLAFPRNDGLRIDHVFATMPMAETSTAAWVDRDQRKGRKTDIPSDHAPVVVDFGV